MNLLPIALRIYCVAAIVLLGWYGFAISGQVRQMRAESTVLRAEIDVLSSSESQASERYMALESKQRRERGSYSGEEAVLASSAVMAAKEEYETLSSSLKASMQKQAQLETTSSALQLRVVPVIAIALLHLFGFFMIRLDSQER